MITHGVKSACEVVNAMIFEQNESVKWVAWIRREFSDIF